MSGEALSRARVLAGARGPTTLGAVLAALAAALALAASSDGRLAAAGAPAGGPRAAAATRPLLGAPYLASALGEGGGRDPDPRFRVDAFDCLSFVETAVALGSATTAAEAALALDDVRYGGAPSLAARNHEVLSQWIPANLAKGWIEDATHALAGERAFPVEKRYTAESWEAVRRAGRGIPGLPRARLPLGRFAALAVAAADVPSLAARIPDGTIAFTLRDDADDRPTRVTHAGVVVRGPRGEALVRHASSSKGVRRVIEEPLDRFLRRQQQALPRRPLAGLAFFTIRDNRARLRELAAGAIHPARAESGRPPVPPPPPL